MTTRFLAILSLSLLICACTLTRKNGDEPQPEPDIAERADTTTPPAEAEPEPAEPAPVEIAKPEAKPLAEQLRELAQAFGEKHELPGMVCGVVRDGKLDWSYGYNHGSADVPNAQTVFRLGSITKVLTSQAILILRDEGKLSLDDPVAKHVAGLPEIFPGSGDKPILVRHLVAHSSGLPTVGDGTLDWTTGKAITEAELIASIGKCRLRFEPGTRLEYSNVGVALAGVVVSRASGSDYRTFMQERLLTPLGMADTAWDRDAYGAERVWPGHVRSGTTWSPPKNYWVLGAIEPAGGLYSTLGDLAKFAAYQLSPTEDGPLATKSVVESQSIPENSRVGIGWFGAMHPRLGQIVWHNGATFAYSAMLMLAPEKKCAIVVLASTGNPAVIQGTDRLAVEMLGIATTTN